MADAVRHLVQTTAGLGFGGNRKIAQTLARAGWKLSHETVRRIRKESSPPEPETASARPKARRHVQPRYPNHIWLADLTIVRSLFGLFHFHIAALLDGFSRMTLAVQCFRSEPSAFEMASLFHKACRRFGPPRHFVSDQGPQFTADTFRELLGSWGVRHRFGAIGKTGSIALIERFWRTLRELGGLRFSPPLLLSDLTRRLEPALIYYAYFRPHEGLDGTTPAEVYFGQRPQHLDAVSPPRASPGEGLSSTPLEVRFIDHDQRFLVLVRKAA